MKAEATMGYQQQAVLLDAHIRNTIGTGPFPPMSSWPHIGAVLSDSVLQAGVTYETTVRPRIERLISDWPDAATLAGFQHRIATDNLGAQLEWRGKKVVTIRALAERLARQGVNTIDDLRMWLLDDVNRNGLREIHGIADKSIDYLCCLVHVQRFAIDTHLRRFARDAGVTATTYEDLNAVYVVAARILGADPCSLDHAIWQHLSAG
jgi:hypothetical protein